MDSGGQAFLSRTNSLFNATTVLFFAIKGSKGHDKDVGKCFLPRILETIGAFP